MMYLMGTQIWELVLESSLESFFLMSLSLFVQVMARLGLFGPEAEVEVWLTQYVLFGVTYDG